MEVRRKLHKRTLNFDEEANEVVRNFVEQVLTEDAGKRGMSQHLDNVWRKLSKG
ncbi:MAG: hypothetical protein ACTS7D_00905 [Candidatus Hodgkinia cicadicola]